MRFVLRRGDYRRRENACACIRDDLSHEKDWQVLISEYVPKRSLDQNAYFHAVPLKMICDFTGFNMDEMKEYLMGEAFGWTEYEILGTKRQRPARGGTSELTTKEFSWFIEWVLAWAATTLNLNIPAPE